MGVKFEFWFTQTSHSVAFVCNLLLVEVISTFWKGDLASRSKATVFTCLVRTTHLGCFGAWFGAHVWVTFFACNLYIENMTFSSFYFSPSPLLILSLPNGSFTFLASQVLPCTSFSLVTHLATFKVNCFRSTSC